MWHVLILFISDGTYILTSTQNDRFFMAILFTLRFIARHLVKGIREENIPSYLILFEMSDNILFIPMSSGIPIGNV